MSNYLHMLRQDRENGIGPKNVKISRNVDSVQEFNYANYLRALFIKFVKKYPRYEAGLPLIAFYDFYSMNTKGKQGYGQFLSFEEFEDKISESKEFSIKYVGGIKEIKNKK